MQFCNVSAALWEKKNQNEQNNDSFLKITHVYGDKLEKSVLREDRYDNIMTCFCVVVK